MSTETPDVDAQRPDWVGQDALRWVIDEAPVPVDLAWTLTVIARRCDEHGKGSFQSKRTLAEKTGKSEDQVSRDVKELLKLGLIRLGDQTLPGQGKNKNRYKPGQWPTVYDVAMEKKGLKPSRRSKNPTGAKKTQPASDADTPCMDATPRMEAGGGMDAPGTPCMDADPTPCMDAPQRRPSKNPSNKTQREMPAKQASRQRADAEGWRMLTVLRSYNEAEAKYLIGALTLKHGIYSDKWWRTAHDNETLDDRIEEVIAEYRENHAASHAASAA